MGVYDSSGGPQRIPEPEVIIGLDFGKARSNKIWAISNEQIARAICEFQELRERNDRSILPVILQKETGFAHINVCEIGGTTHGVRYNESSRGKYLDTYEVLRQAWKLMKKQGWQYAVIVAHPAHYRRCVAIAKWFGIRPMCQYQGHLKRISFDPQSAQIWTRNRYFFFAWTILGYFKFWLTRKETDK